MRRHEKEINDQAEIEEVINNSLVCRLAVADENRPYIVPVSFGYENMIFYFHGAKKGKKLDILKKNLRVCIELDTGAEIVRNSKPCLFGMNYKSVIAFGNVSFIDEPKEKKQALNIIMKKYSGREFLFDEAMLKATEVFMVKIHEMTGKKSG